MTKLVSPKKYRKKPGGKYNKKSYSVPYGDGEIIFDSYPEAYYFGILRAMEDRKLIHLLRRQPEYPFYVGNHQAWIYRADFEYQELDADGVPGKWVTVEIKSTFTNKDASWNLKRKAFELSQLYVLPPGQPRELQIKQINKRAPS